MVEKKPVVLKDIALKTGFSINTVARALKGRADVAPESKALIRRTAEEMGYIYNNAAGSLRAGHTNTIAVIVADITNPTFSIGLLDVEQQAIKDGYAILILNTNEDPDKELKAIMTALSKKVAGLLICPCADSEDNLSFLQKTNTPFVLVGRKANPEYNWVVRNDTNCGMLAAYHLIKNAGCSRILLLNGPEGISSAGERKEGFMRILSESGIKQDPRLVYETDVKPKAIDGLIPRLISEGVKFDGVFGFSDIIAMQAINDLEQCGLSVPGDVSVVGVDNLCGSLPFLIKTDSIGECDQELYYIAYLRLIDILKSDNRYTKHMTVDVKLYQYGSVKTVV